MFKTLCLSLYINKKNVDFFVYVIRGIAKHHCTIYE